MSDIKEDQVLVANDVAAPDNTIIDSTKPEEVETETMHTNDAVVADGTSSNEADVVTEPVEASTSDEPEATTNGDAERVVEAEANGHQSHEISETNGHENGHTVEAATEAVENGHHVEENGDKMDITTSPVEEKVEIGVKRARDEDDVLADRSEEENENGEETKKLKLDNGDTTEVQPIIEANNNGTDEPQPKRKPGRPKKSESMSEAKAVIEEAAVDDAATISRRTRSKA